MRLLILIPLVAAASAASAAEHGYSIQDFDRIRVEGPYEVHVRVGPPATARAQGPQTALDRLSVTSNDGMLVIRPDHNGWGGWPGGQSEAKVVVTVTTRGLRSVALAGSGALDVDRMRAPEIQVGVTGSGDVSVGAVDADAVQLSIAGSGDIRIAGRTKQVRANVQGSGDIDAANLGAQDVIVAAAGSGDLALAASRSAKITSAGSGDVAVTGTASCTVSRVGSGDVSCGRGG